MIVSLRDGMATKRRDDPADGSGVGLFGGRCGDRAPWVVMIATRRAPSGRPPTTYVAGIHSLTVPTVVSRWVARDRAT
ncbi:hypothetical protein GCM10010172_18390 [Paractinoplanes ferrugineus]|uniref:Uncharacterized protein n=1 Tax=Paractinoplanes ferrugineus TaxID=113564 RepID=A0A919J6Q0_9ACTN|nr:hypothetical protein Afe05nite_67100 [Actinoplanes ferrugineus]